MKIIMVTFALLMSVVLAGEVYAGDMVNVNTASIEQLQTIKGIGPKNAAAIVAYRKEHGGFSSLDALTMVKGIGEKKLKKIEDGLTIGNEKK